ncbi:MAG: hypothetical protein V1648_01775 [Candidatus Aenigmatarchaeota archaeon]
MSYGKSPWIAAFLNFVTWGAGYIYIRHRMVLGTGLLLVTIINFMILVSMPAEIILPSSELFYVWLSFIWVALSLLFAVDAFMETQDLNKI